MGFIETKADDVLGRLAAVVTEEAEKSRLAFAQAMRETLRGIRVDAALPRPVQMGATNYAAGGRLVGWSLRASGAEAVVELYDGYADPSRLLASLDLPAGSSQTQTIMPAGVMFTDSLFVAQTSGTGTVTGTVWIGAVD